MSRSRLESGSYAALAFATALALFLPTAALAEDTTEALTDDPCQTVSAVTQGDNADAACTTTVETVTGTGNTSGDGDAEDLVDPIVEQHEHAPAQLADEPEAGAEDVAIDANLSVLPGNSDETVSNEKAIESPVDSADIIAALDDSSVSETEAQPDENQPNDAPASQDPASPADETLDPMADARQGHWVVDARSGSLERYWVWNDNGSVAKGMLITPQNGAGYYAWAMADGRILRGKWDSGRGKVYIADNAGKLIGSDMKQDGWVVTGKYDGHLERYYVEATSKAARSGFFTVDGYGDVFGTGGHGYVIRTDFTFGNRKWSADNDGRLRSGWYVTSSFGQGLQRYWMGDTVYGSPHAAAVSRLVDSSKEKSGYDAYAMADGTILRGRWDNGRGRVYIADNGGKLIGSGMSASGWVVTSKFDGHLERYYVDGATKAACSGFFTVEGYGDAFGQGGTGRILRGTMTFGNSVILADNDGRLPSKNGWLISNKYGQGTQRYWIEPIFGPYRGTKPGYTVNGWTHFTLPQGYVLRNSDLNLGKGVITRADNDGRLGKVVPEGFLKITSVTFTPTQKIALHEGIDFYKEDGAYHLERDFLRTGDTLVIKTNRGTKTYAVDVKFGDATLINQGDPYDTLKVWAFGNNDNDGVGFDVDPKASVIKVSYMGTKGSVPVEIQADPIRSVSYQRPGGAKLVEGVDSYEWSDYYNGQWVVWPRYQTWMTLGDELAISYSDGTKKTYVYKATTRDGYPAELFVNADDAADTLDLDIWFDSDQSYTNQWKPGKHRFTYELYGRSLAFDVEVVARAK